jgi:hypothetical protein
VSAEETRSTISRVLVELGGLADGDEVIETACDLAAAIQAELYGLFVEEESLLDLSGLPFAHTVLPGRTQAQALNPELLRQVYERLAASSRRALSARAHSAHLTWSFNTARGHGAAEIRAKVSRTDLVVIQQHRFGQSALELVVAARGTATVARGVVLIGRRSKRATGPIVAIDDGDEAGAETVALAARLARRHDAPVELFVIATDERSARQTEARDLALLGDVRVAAVRKFVDRPDGTLEDALTRTAPRFVVADLDGAPFRDDESAVRLVRAARAPIVLIKPASTA